MNHRRVVYLVVSLDVEEEGLFGGNYARRGYTTTNTAALEHLVPLCRIGVRPTLFCAYSVLTDTSSRDRLARLCEDHGVELGAHLHHWNTPPLSLQGNDSSLPDITTEVPAAGVPPDLLAEKLFTLMKAGQSIQGTQMISFRMGRWDAQHSLWPLLAQAGVLVDASVRPLHCGSTPLAGPDHFDAPNIPYWIPTPKGNLFEVPLTVTPLFQKLPALLRRIPAKAGIQIRASLRHWGVMALLPVYHPLWAMKFVTSLYLARGGQVLSLTWHSSEMMPGCTPHLPDNDAVQCLLRKIDDWLEWLHTHYTVRCLTMNELMKELGPTSPTFQGIGDWTSITI